MRDDIYDPVAYQNAISARIRWNARKTRERKWREEEPELSAQLDDLFYGDWPTDMTSEEYGRWRRLVRAMPRFIFESLEEWGGLTPKQADVARNVFEKQGEREQAWDAAETERRANAPAWEEGRAEVRGRIVSAKLKEQPSFSYYAGVTRVWKVTMLADDGRKLWCTAPDKLLDAILSEARARGDSPDYEQLDRLLRGRYLTIRATVKPSDDDPTFGFGKRPFMVALEDKEQDDE